jgi:hypothetical protein
MALIFSGAENSSARSATENKSLSPHHTPSRYAFVASSSEKYRKMEKNLLVIDIMAALENNTRGVAALIPAYAQVFAFSSDGGLCLCGNGKSAEAVLIDAGKAPASPTESIVAKIPLQAPPTLIAIARGKPLAFIAENQAKSLQVLDLEKARAKPDQALLATVQLKSPLLSMTISPDNAHLLMVDQKLHVLSISRIFIDPESAEIAAIAPQYHPASLIFDRKGDFFYLSDTSSLVLSLFNYRQALAEPDKSLIRTGRTRIEADEKFPEKCPPLSDGLALCPGTSFLFMIHPALDRMSVIDTDKIKEGSSSWGISRVPTGKSPQQMAFTSGGEMVLVNNLASGNIFIFDSRTCVSSPEEALLAKIAIPSPAFLMMKPEE